MGSTCGSAGKETPCNGRRPRFHPWVGKIRWRTERLPSPVFRPGEFHELCSPWGCKESDTTATFTFTLNCIFYAFPIISFSQEIPRNIIDGVFLPPQPTFPSSLEVCQIPERHCSSKTPGEVNDSLLQKIPDLQACSQPPQAARSQLGGSLNPTSPLPRAPLHWRLRAVKNCCLPAGHASVFWTFEWQSARIPWSTLPL